MRLPPVIKVLVSIDFPVGIELTTLLYRLLNLVI